MIDFSDFRFVGLFVMHKPHLNHIHARLLLGGVLPKVILGGLAREALFFALYGIAGRGSDVKRFSGLGARFDLNKNDVIVVLGDYIEFVF